MTFLPIVARELRTAARRRSTYWVRLAAALLVLIVGIWLYLLMPTDDPKDLSIFLFGMLAFGAVLAIAARAQLSDIEPALGLAVDMKQHISQPDRARFRDQVITIVSVHLFDAVHLQRGASRNEWTPENLIRELLAHMERELLATIGPTRADGSPQQRDDDRE